MIVVAPLELRTAGGFPLKAMRIYVDINGSKKPNMWGKDFFYFVYTRTDDPSFADENGKFLPNGARLSENELITRNDGSSCHNNQYGYSCAALIMKQNWEITDDFHGSSDIILSLQAAAPACTNPLLPRASYNNIAVPSPLWGEEEYYPL